MCAFAETEDSAFNHASVEAAFSGVDRSPFLSPSTIVVEGPSLETAFGDNGKGYQQWTQWLPRDDFERLLRFAVVEDIAIAILERAEAHGLYTDVLDKMRKAIAEPLA